MSGGAKRVEIVRPELAGPLDRAVRGLFGVTGGKARAESLSASKRKNIARKAAEARWKRENKK